ncbi:hypothetical protein LXA43DRAFT_1078537 [Ganoderma leucocontextum]|nr:hypothetical protein LXA43DRAFT_1078537 [Ganoderma leucocontextum]
MDKVMMVFSTVLLILNTIFWTTQVYFGQRMWINNPDYPGGIDGYLQDNSSIYRCFVVWDSRRITMIPSILWVSSVVFAVGLLYGSGRPNGDYFAGLAATFVTAYTASTFALNVIVTGLICGRLVYIQCYMQNYYGADRRLYAGAVAIVVESALPFTLFNLAYLVAFAVDTDIAFAFSFYAMFTSMATISYHCGPTHIAAAGHGTSDSHGEMGSGVWEATLKHLPDLTAMPV